MAQVDVLLRILAIEVDIVRHFTEVRGAGHTRVTVGNVESTRVTHVPIGVLFHGIGVWGLLVLGPGAKLGESGEPNGPVRSVKSTPCRGWRTVRWDAARGAGRAEGIALESTCSGSGRNCDTCWGIRITSPSETSVRGATTSISSAASICATGTPTADTNVECNSIQSFDDAVESGMGRILDRGEVCKLLFLSLHRGSGCRSR